jgi:hypothetical protein
MPRHSLRACACGQHYDAERWAELPLFTRLTAADVSSLVTAWSPDAAVEVRVCTSCRSRMARLQPRELDRTKSAIAA